MRRLVVVLVVLLSSCSLIVTNGLPKHHQVQPGVLPECSQSNGPAGIDLLLMILSGAGMIAAIHDASDPAAPEDTKDDAMPAAVLLGASSIVTGYSMIRGFDRSRACRDAVRAAGFHPRGENDWVMSLLIVGAAAAAAASSSASAPAATDPDLCRPGAIQTAMCRDGRYSCSLHREGTCSHHGGVSYWL